MPVFESYAQGTPSWVELMTPDQEGAARFYDRLFGWETETDPLDDEGHVYLTETVRGYAVAGIGGHPTDHPAAWNVFLAVDDIDAVTARVEPAGGTVEAGPFDVMDHGRMSVIEDPTGARVCLWQAGTMIGTALADEPGTPVWHEVMTGDVARAARFYADVLGMGAQPTDLPGDDYTVLTNTEGREVGGALTAPMAGMPSRWSVYFQVEDVDATVERAVGLGGRVVAPAFDIGGVGRMAVLADPQGAVFDVMAALMVAEPAGV